MIINNLVTKYTKSYATQEACIKAVEKKLGEAQKNNSYDLIIIVKDGRHLPIIKWRKPMEYRVRDSVDAGFYTIN